MPAYFFSESFVLKSFFVKVLLARQLKNKITNTEYLFTFIKTFVYNWFLL